MIRIDKPYPAILMENFYPNISLLRAAAESFNQMDDWVKYGGEESNQVQWCNKLGRENITDPAKIVLDYVVENFDPLFKTGK